MRPPRGRRHGSLGPYSYHFSDYDLRETIEIVNRGDCLYSSWRPAVVEEQEDEQVKKENRRWPKTRRS